ncbi:MAG: hypothetical protein U0231_10375 [Nitrospiraceae bacterium]
MRKEPISSALWPQRGIRTWWPVNIHRIIANVVLGGYICGAYAGIRYLSAKTTEERYHYDWMGYVGNFIGVFGLLPLPFAGYWLMREIYQYNQQMGITLMGGFLSWLFILQAMLIGVLFLSANYYFWLGITHRIPGSEVQYRKPIMAMLVILLLCLGVWMTPHSLVASLEEARKMGGTHHPLLGVFGVMSAKMTVSNLMILVTFMSFIMYWRAGKEDTAGWAKAAKAVMGAVLVLAGIAVIVLGVWGYFVPAIIRINYFSTSQVGIVLFVMLTITPLTALLLKSAKTTTEMVWGKMPPRAGYSLVLNAIMVILLMTLMAMHGPPHGSTGTSTVSCVTLSLCLFTGFPRVRCRVHGAMHVPVLSAGGLHFLRLQWETRPRRRQAGRRPRVRCRRRVAAMAGGSPDNPSQG